MRRCRVCHINAEKKPDLYVQHMVCHFAKLRVLVNITQKKLLNRYAEI